MPQYYQTLTAVWGNQILFFWFLTTNFNIWLLPWALVNMHIWACISEMTIHRYFTHKSYVVTSRWKEHLLKIGAFLVGQGAILSWATVHRQHHRKEDTELDPHSPMHRSWLKILFGFIPSKYPKNLITDFIRHRDRKYFIFENNYYWLMWIATWILSYLISPYLFFTIVSGSSMWYFATIIVNIFAHNGMLGKKSYSESSAYNTRLLEFVSSAGKHNNHHKKPYSYTYALDPKTEFDWIGSLIEKFADEIPTKKPA